MVFVGMLGGRGVEGERHRRSQSAGSGYPKRWSSAERRQRHHLPLAEGHGRHQRLLRATWLGFWTPLTKVMASLAFIQASEGTGRVSLPAPLVDVTVILPRTANRADTMAVTRDQVITYWPPATQRQLAIVIAKKSLFTSICGDPDPAPFPFNTHEGPSILLVPASNQIAIRRNLRAP